MDRDAEKVAALLQRMEETGEAREAGLAQTLSALATHGYDVYSALAGLEHDS